MEGLNIKDVLTPSSWKYATGVLEEALALSRQNDDFSISRVVELEMYHKNGSTVWVEVSTRFVRSINGQSPSIVGVTRDITKRKFLESQLRQAHKMEAIGTLAGGIAHDFNNILAPVIGYTELALDEIEKGTPLEEYLQEIYTAGKRAKELVKQILIFARQTDGESKPTRVGSIAKEALKLLRSSIPATIDIRHNIESDSLVMGNATEIHQIFMNLCTNAAHAMENNGGVLEVGLTDVTLGTDFTGSRTDLEPGDYLKLVVSDTGTGIPSAVIDSIFEPYFTTKAPNEGTGIGLSTVHGIVKNYGGEIEVESESGKGTVFTLYLPVTKKYSQDRSYEKETLPSGTERILFVDDELPIARMGSQILDRLGYTVTIRTSSIEALELFRSRPGDFDLVISDTTMPNMTGDRLADELLKIRPDIPIILCTGYSKKFPGNRQRKSESGPLPTNPS